MTTLAIIPNYEKKRLKIVGTVAAGEHVLVTAVGASEWTGEGSALRLRVLFGGKTVAVFPYWTEENEDDWPEGVSADEWDTTGEDPTCTLVLNTIQAEKMLRFGGECLWVLDDAENHTLYGTGEFHVEGWPKSRPADVPYNLDGYPDFVEEAKAAMAYALGDAQAAAASAAAVEAEIDGVMEGWTPGETLKQRVASDVTTEVSTQLSGKVDKDGDKVLSDNNFTDAYKAKLDGVAAGAEVNVQSDWNQGNSSADDFIKNKPTAMKNPAALTFGSKTYDGSAAKTLTAADLGALTSHQDISGKADKSDTYTKSQVDAIVAAVKSGSRQIVASLASVTDPQPLVIYMVAKSTAQTNNAYDEYIYITVDNVGKWEKIGDTEIDLSGYAQTASLAAVATSGSYNDLSNKPTIPAAVSVDSALSGSSTNPVQNKVVTAALNGKATAAQGAKADAALSRAEAVAGFTEWVCNPAMIGDERVYIEWDGNYWIPTNGGGKSGLVNGNATSTNLAWEANDWWGGVPLTATRTRLPTMADIPTDNAQLTNGAGYVTTAAMNTALAASLPYALVDVTVESMPSIPATMFPIKAVIFDELQIMTSAQDCVLTTSGSQIVLSWAELPDTAIAYFDGSTGAYSSTGVPSALTFGSDEHAPTSSDILIITPTATLADRAINAVSLSAAATGIRLVFPAAQTGKVRDFLVRLTIPAGDAPQIAYPEGVAFENADGSFPEINTDESAAATTLLMFTETAPATGTGANATPARFLVKGEALKEVS